MTEHLTSTSLVIFFKVLSVNKLCQVQFVNIQPKRRFERTLCSVNKEKLFPALHRNLYTEFLCNIQQHLWVTTTFSFTTSKGLTENLRRKHHRYSLKLSICTYYSIETKKTNKEMLS